MAKKHILFTIVMLLLLAGCQNNIIGKNPVSEAVEQAVSEAFFLQAEENKNEEIVFLLYESSIDYIEFNEDATQALVWFAVIDEESGEIIGTEPGLALATLTNQTPEEASSWLMTFQHQSEWTDAVWQTDDALLEAAEKQTFSGKAQVTTHDTTQIFTGYKLPWPQGMQTKLSGSIAHVFIYKTCPDTCLYAFDFWNGEMFPVSAARGGVVKTAVWQYANGTTEGTNYLLIEDTSTSPTTYQIYYHLAYDSIPEDLRTAGAVVYQGQFIGNADDTGASTANHLHFMVHTNPYSYWGSSVDILFDEVQINNGRPRTCNEADLYPEYGNECIDGDWFLSDNTDSTPPTAWIDMPVEGATITSQVFTAIAYAEDDIGVKTISMFLRQGTAGWQEVGESQNQNSITTEIDMCDLGLEDGEIQLAIEVVDSDNKVFGTYDDPLTVTKDYDCSAEPPSCVPAPNQIALYTGTNYTGSCAIVPLGDYYGMVYVDGIENDTVSSLLVGNHAYTILYADTNLKGDYELFTDSDPDLSDNTIGDNMLSSLTVKLPPDHVHTPTLPESFTVVAGELTEISWTGDADEYYAELQQDGITLLFQDWSQQTSFTMGYLEAGDYELIVKARNLLGEVSTTYAFSVEISDNNIPATAMTALPATTTDTTIQLDWEVTAGADNIANFDLQYRINGGVWKTLSQAILGTQRSFLTILETGYTYEFRMRAIAIEGTSEAFPATAETKIEVLASCTQDLYESDDQIEDAALLSAEEAQIHNFCPENDVDWIKVAVDEGNTVIVEIDPLDGVLPITVEQYTAQQSLEQTVTVQEETAKISINESGEWYLRITPYDETVQGENTSYQVQIAEQGNLFFYLLIGIGTAFLLALLGLMITIFRKKE